MQSSNPVFTRSTMFAPAGQSNTAQQPYGSQYPQPGYYGENPGYAQSAGYGEAAVQPVRMTLDDVIAKTGLLILLTVASAAVAWFVLPFKYYMPVLMLSSLVGFVTAMFVSMRRKIAVPLVVAYAIIEGLFIGTFSVIFERFIEPGIVTQAVLGTFAAAGVTLAAYKYLGVRVQGRLAKIVVISVIAYAVAMLANFVLSFAGIDLGFAAVGASAGWLAYGAAGLGAVLAVASLLMDFEYVENGIRSGAPAEESWRAAFGLLVTMVWLYTTILRILSFFRND